MKRWVCTHPFCMTMLVVAFAMAASAVFKSITCGIGRDEVSLVILAATITGGIGFYAWAERGGKL